MPDAQRAEIAKLESLHADHPEGRIFTHLAEAYRKAGELERARQVLAEGIERHPDYSSAHVVLARVLADQGANAEAEAEFRRVLQLDSHNLVALRSLGDLARDAGRTEEAIELYRRLLDVEPSDEDVRAAVREIEEGPSGEEDSPWATDLEADELTPAVEDEPWTVGDAADQAEEMEQEEAFADPGWSPGEDAAADGGEAADDGFAPIPDLGEPGVLTETIAQVYARQGLYDRAAEVYRQLLQARPGDAGLRTRMEEMEALAAAQHEPGEPRREPGLETVRAVEPEPAPEIDTEPEVEPPVEPDVGLPVSEPEAPAGDVEPLPGLETAEPEAVPHVPPLGGLETDEIDPETGLRTDEPSWQDWSEPSTAEESLSEPVDAADADVFDFTEQAGTDAEPEAEAVESVWTGAGGASGAEESPYAWAEGEPAEDPSEPIDSYLRSLLGWSGGGTAGPASGGEATGGEAVGGGDAADRAAGEAPEPGAQGPSAPEGADTAETPDAADAADDDDDLDTFRSWLENLKR